MNRSILRIAALAIFALALGAGPALGSDGVATLGSPPPEEDSAAVATTSDDPMEGLLDYAACMREQGIDMPDPQMSGGGFVMEIEASVSADGPVTGDMADIMGSEFLAADEACVHLMGAMVSDVDPALEAEMMEQLLAHAECMRENGIDLPDPQMSGGLISIGAPGGPEEAGNLAFDPFSEEYVAAEEACRDVLPFADGGFDLSAHDG